jgi:hypothetical protein
MITGSHSIIYSKNPVADRAVLRDVLKFPHVDVGEGWLIFGLPPSEVAVHPSEENDVHEFYLMCDDVEQFVAEMKRHGIACSPVANRGWGMLTEVKLPGGGKLGVYQPRHARPPNSGNGRARARGTGTGTGARGRARTTGTGTKTRARGTKARARSTGKSSKKRR